MESIELYAHEELDDSRGVSDDEEAKVQAEPPDTQNRCSIATTGQNKSLEGAVAASYGLVRTHELEHPASPAARHEILGGLRPSKLVPSCLMPLFPTPGEPYSLGPVFPPSVLYCVSTTRCMYGPLPPSISQTEQHATAPGVGKNLFSSACELDFRGEYSTELQTTNHVLAHEVGTSFEGGSTEDMEAGGKYVWEPHTPSTPKNIEKLSCHRQKKSDETSGRLSAPSPLKAHLASRSRSKRKSAVQVVSEGEITRRKARPFVGLEDVIMVAVAEHFGLSNFQPHDLIPFMLDKGLNEKMENGEGATETEDAERVGVMVARRVAALARCGRLQRVGEYYRMVGKE